MHGASEREAGGCIPIFGLHLYCREVRRICYTPLTAHLFCSRFKAVESAASVPLPDFGTNRPYDEQLALRPTESRRDRNRRIIPLIVSYKFSKSPSLLLDGLAIINFSQMKLALTSHVDTKTLPGDCY